MTILTVYKIFSFANLAPLPYKFFKKMLQPKIQGMFDSLPTVGSLSHCYQFRPKPTHSETLSDFAQKKHTDRGKCSRIQFKQTKHSISKSTLQLINSISSVFSIFCFYCLNKILWCGLHTQTYATHVHTKKQKCEPAVYSQTEVSDRSREISII